VKEALRVLGERLDRGGSGSPVVGMGSRKTTTPLTRGTTSAVVAAAAAVVVFVLNDVVAVVVDSC
jgi:hypothetical protein